MAEQESKPATESDLGIPEEPEAEVVAETTALKLQPLTAAHDGPQHELYSNELIDLLNDDKRRAAVWNIALTGNYGSGKSSVLAGVRDELDKGPEKATSRPDFAFFAE